MLSDGSEDDPEARQAALTALEVSAPYAVGAMKGLFRGRAEKAQAERAVALLRQHTEIWQAQDAVLAEPVALYPATRILLQQGGTFSGTWALRVTNVAPFAVTLIGVEAQVAVFLGGQLALSTGAKQVDNNCKCLLRNGRAASEPTALADLTGRKVLQYDVSGSWLKTSVPALPDDLRVVTQTEISGKITIRGPWKDSDQQVPFSGTIWLPVQGVLR